MSLRKWPVLIWSSTFSVPFANYSINLCLTPLQWDGIGDLARGCQIFQLMSNSKLLGEEIAMVSWPLAKLAVASKALLAISEHLGLFAEFCARLKESIVEAESCTIDGGASGSGLVHHVTAGFQLYYGELHLARSWLGISEKFSTNYEPAASMYSLRSCSQWMGLPEVLRKVFDLNDKVSDRHI